MDSYEHFKTKHAAPTYWYGYTDNLQGRKAANVGGGRHHCPVFGTGDWQDVNVFNAHKNSNSFMSTAQQLMCSPGLDIAWLR